MRVRSPPGVLPDTPPTEQKENTRGSTQLAATNFLQTQNPFELEKICRRRLSRVVILLFVGLRSAPFY